MAKKTSKRKVVAVAIECVGITVVSVGIGLELAYGGEVYFLVITVGSVIIATGALLWAKIWHG